MKASELRKRIARSAVLVVADLGRETAEVRTIAALGARVLAAGLGGEAERALLGSLRLDAEGVTEARAPVLAAALERLGAADAVLFGTGEWTKEREEIFDAEREQAIADGRSLRPIVARSDAGCEFLGSAAEAAAFAAARAAGADFETAKKFARPAQGRERKLGHEDKDREPAAGSRSREARPRRGQAR